MVRLMKNLHFFNHSLFDVPVLGYLLPLLNSSHTELVTSVIDLMCLFVSSFTVASFSSTRTPPSCSWTPPSRQTSSPSSSPNCASRRRPPLKYCSHAHVISSRSSTSSSFWETRVSIRVAPPSSISSRNRPPASTFSATSATRRWAFAFSPSVRNRAIFCPS